MEIVIRREGEVLSGDAVESAFHAPLASALNHRLVSPSGNSYIIRFVGWWSVRGNVILSLPKVFPEDVNGEDFNFFAKALRRYCTSGVRFLHDESGRVHGVEDLPFLFERIAEHTERYGWHAMDAWSDSDQIEYADWGRTFRDHVAFSSGFDLVFIETIGSYPCQSRGDLQALQACALVDLWDGMGGILFAPDHPSSALVEEARGLLAEVDQPASPEAVVLEFMTVNRDHDRELAQLLGQWIGIESCSSLHQSYNGTTSFEHVWEEMVRAAVSAVPGFQCEHHVHVASQPVYRDVAGSELYNPGSQRPDVVGRLGSDLIILDAKWYEPQSYPGAGDIVKQFVYELTSHEIAAFNAFIVPMVNGAVDVMGECFMQFAGEIDPRFRPFLVVGVPVMALLSAFATHRESEIGEHILEAIRGANHAKD
jgi:hypothetical protein